MGEEKGKFDSIIRAPKANNWTADKYGRMAVYTLLYNKIKDMPKSFKNSDFGNNLTSGMIRDYIAKNFDYLIERFELDKKNYMHFDAAGKKQFLAEMDEYNEHAMEVGTALGKGNDNKEGCMPNAVEMGQFLEAVKEQRRSYFESLRKSVKVESGEEFDGDKSKQGYLIQERLNKVNEIREQKRLLGRTRFWAGMKGLGALGSSALAVGSLFVLPIGIVGVVGGAMGASSCARSLARSFGKIFAQRRKLRDLNNKIGSKGKDRGLKEIERKIENNRDLLGIYNDFEQLITVQKNDKGVIYNYQYPTKEEFIEFIRKHYPRIYARRDNLEDGLSLDKLYTRAIDFQSVMKGGFRSSMEFVKHNQTTVYSNDEIAIERDVEYEEMFGSEAPSFTLNNSADDKLDEKSEKIMKQNLSQFIAELRRFEKDEGTYSDSQEQLKYVNMEAKAAEILPVMFQKELFDKPLDGVTYRQCKQLLEDPTVKKFLEKSTTGNKTSYLKNAMKFIELEMVDKNSDLAIQTNLGVSINEQLNIDADVMENACVNRFKIEKDGADYVAIQNLATQIQNAETKEQCTQVRAMISSSVANAGARRYLESMIDRKKSESKFSVNDITNELKMVNGGKDDSAFFEISKLISSIEYHNGNYTCNGQSLSYMRERINEKMRDVENYNEISAKVDELISNQLESLERKDMDAMRLDAVNAIRNNTVNKDVEEILNKINGYTLEDVKKDEVKNMYNQEIYYIQPESVKKYIQSKLQMKVQRLYEVELRRTDLYTDQKGLEDLSKDLKTVKAFTFLTEGQKQRILTEFGKRAKTAFDVKLQYYQSYALIPSESQKLLDNLTVWRNFDSTAGGFRDILSIDTKDVNEINAKLDRMASLMEIKDQITGKAMNATEIIDGESPETKLFLKLYNDPDMEKDGPFRELNVNLRGLNAKINALNFEGLQARPEGDAEKREKENFEKNYAVKLELTGDKSRFDAGDDPVGNEVKLAELLILKKKLLANFKSQLALLVKPIQANYQSTLATDDVYAKRFAEIKQNWSKLLGVVDEKCLALIDSLKRTSGNKLFNSGITYVPATEIIKTVTNVNVLNYINLDKQVINSSSSSSPLSYGAEKEM